MTKKKWWTPELWSQKRAGLELRNRARAALCGVFAAEGFMEVETPALQISPGLETHLMAFGTQLENQAGKSIAQLYLHTSPEFTMKKLLAAGAGDIFQFARVFRNREGSATHHPEFTMIEWYRSGADYRKIMDDTILLVRAVGALATGRNFSWHGKTSDPFTVWEKISVVDAFRKYANLDLEKSLGDGLATDRDLLATQAKAIGIGAQANDSWDDIFFRIFLEKIETRLGIGQPTILFDYPACMGALARRKISDPRFAERFEVYICGMELANAFTELTDVEEQRARFTADMQKKQELYGFTYPIDEDFLDALAIMPPAAGIALGFDRLVILAAGAEHIEDILFAPVHEYR